MTRFFTFSLLALTLLMVGCAPSIVASINGTDTALVRVNGSTFNLASLNLVGPSVSTGDARCSTTDEPGANPTVYQCDLGNLADGETATVMFSGADVRCVLFGYVGDQVVPRIVRCEVIE